MQLGNQKEGHEMSVSWCQSVRQCKCVRESSGTERGHSSGQLHVEGLAFTTLYSQGTFTPFSGLKKQAISTLLEGGVIHMRESPKMSTYYVPEELWTEVQDIVQEAVIKTVPKKKKCKKAKWLSEAVLQTASL